MPATTRLLLLLSVLACPISHADAPIAAALPLANVELHGQSFAVEVAHTGAQRTQGLMFRSAMAADHGMLFLFPQARKMAFWMKNTLIPLDILFFDQQGRLLRAYREVPPCRATPCRNYSSGAAATMVLELNGGRSANMALNAQTRLLIKNRSKLPPAR